MLIDFINAKIKIIVLINENPARKFALENDFKPMNWKIITWYIGISLVFVALLMGVAGIVACCTPGDESRIPLL